ncbi:DUF3560 domain-containing protein [Streptomyces sp. HUCO-GS316]|uniref:DUF3560 domain-containing protein n=1 Tax=Streptomyces sp. HUCO-GS316 TaxID=2692198 RepID=UPI00136FB494|nr:DUF3560 domain-containing protein [Streptomyces sp. HUCO-GS316]MXM67039.1 DUF3560 domain-containing protein [Streptomyces sp. HUCO-GS316]
MSDITITHTHAEGTLADGTERGDGTASILKRHGFRWGRSITCWYVPSSRDRAPRRLAIDAARKELEAAGHTVTVELADDVRDSATVKAATHERLEDRRAALTAKGERLTARSEALHKASNAMVEHIPLGQPVLPGKRGRAHRNLLDRSINKAIEAAQVAGEARQIPDRIAGSLRTEAMKERPDVVKRRVDRMEAELRGIDRRLERLSPGPSLVREQYEGDRAVLVERIASDKEFLQQATEAGLFGRWSKENVHKGDQLLLRGQWRTVVRANAKTVSVSTGYSWTDKYGYEEIRDQRCSHTDADA